MINYKHELITHLWSLSATDGQKWIENVADFILEDRRRIVAPLVQHKNTQYCNNDDYELFKTEAIGEVLKNAGIEMKEGRWI